jgi:L-fucose mutarotase/ribose pyranase (RbsD/FucU family)
MLLGFSPLIGPDLLAILHRMGHADEIVIILRKGIVPS